MNVADAQLLAILALENLVNTVESKEYIAISAGKSCRNGMNMEVKNFVNIAYCRCSKQMVLFKNAKNKSMIEDLIIGNAYICPICKKEFVANGEQKYIIGGGYTCTWKCFCEETKKRAKEKQKTCE